MTNDELTTSELELGRALPDELKDFYRSISNGLAFEGIKVLPIKSRSNLKKTGDSIVRNNGPKYSICYHGDLNTISEFLVFAMEESFACFAFKRGSDQVWYWTADSDKVVELDLGFYEWLADTLKQERDSLKLRPS